MLTVSRYTGCRANDATQRVVGLTNPHASVYKRDAEFLKLFDDVLFARAGVHCKEHERHAPQLFNVCLVHMNGMSDDVSAQGIVLALKVLDFPGRGVKFVECCCTGRTKRVMRIERVAVV